MKHLTALLFILVNTTIYAQDYRLVLDPSTVPELYHTTQIWLQQKTGNSYETVRSRYSVRTEDATLRGTVLSYTNEDLSRTKGNLHFIAEIRGEKIPVLLKVPVLTDIRFNLYTDSIKPILNFYINVEGIFSSGKILPLTEEQISITSDIGTMNGMEWIAPVRRSFEHVTFTAIDRANSAIKKSITVFRKKLPDPRDAENYEEK